VTLQEWLVFLPAAVLVAASPGANYFLAFTNGMRSGLRRATGALVGRYAAFAVMIGLVMLGLGAVLAASEATFTVIKWVGVAYLIWLGLRLWCSDDMPLAAGEATATASWAKLAMQEFAVCMTNPKAVLLFTAFLPQFIDPSRPWTSQFLILGAAYVAVEAAAASGYALAGSRIRALRLGPRGAKRVNRVAGAMMLAAAGWLATARRGT
jgi:threonine/homoserine/homoserine lactone efflux protein